MTVLPSSRRNSDETVTYEYADDTYHTVTTKGGTYCAFCYGTNHTESSKLERHSMVTRSAAPAGEWPLCSGGEV